MLHVAILKGLGLASRNSAVVLNLYYLMAFPLDALSAYFVLADGGSAASPPWFPRSCTPPCRIISSASPVTFSSPRITSFR